MLRPLRVSVLPPATMTDRVVSCRASSRLRWASMKIRVRVCTLRAGTILGRDSERAPCWDSNMARGGTVRVTIDANRGLAGRATTAMTGHLKC